jgi:hypothetical protein
VTRPAILERGEIGAGEIGALLADAADAVRIRAFTDPGVAVRIPQRLERNRGQAVYRSIVYLERSGRATFERHDASGATDPDSLAAYLDAADQLMAEVASPYADPRHRVGGAGRSAHVRRDCVDLPSGQ